MTFYSILFGLVFVTSFLTTVSILGDSTVNLILLAESALVLLMSFNEVINTSESIENEKSDYTLPLKALDALNFVFYMISIFAIQPKSAVYNLDLSTLLSKYNESVFWIAVTIIFLISLLWNITKDKDSTIRYNKFIIFFAVFSFAMCLLSIFFAQALNTMAIIFLAVYFVFLLLKILRPGFQETGS